MNIKNVILPILLLSHSAVAATSQYTCDRLVYSALSFRDHKEVIICISGKKISYTFGNVSVDKPELDILVQPSAAYWTKYNVNIWDTTRAPGDDYRSINNTVGIKNGNYTYEVSSGSIGDSTFDKLVVMKNNKPISKIKLRRESVELDISDYLSELGIERVKGNFWGD